MKKIEPAELVVHLGRDIRFFWEPTEDELAHGIAEGGMEGLFAGIHVDAQGRVWCDVDWGMAVLIEKITRYEVGPFPTRSHASDKAPWSQCICSPLGQRAKNCPVHREVSG